MSETIKVTDMRVYVGGVEIGSAAKASLTVLEPQPKPLAPPHGFKPGDRLRHKDFPGDNLPAYYLRDEPDECILIAITGSLGGEQRVIDRACRYEVHPTNRAGHHVPDAFSRGTQRAVERRRLDAIASRGMPVGVTTEASKPNGDGTHSAMVKLGAAVDREIAKCAIPASELGYDLAAENAKSRRHNATCLRCYGPAYAGLGLPRCERVGGCLAERGVRVHSVGLVDDWPAVQEAFITHDVVKVVSGPRWGSEPAWYSAPDHMACHAMLDLAVAAWRENMLGAAWTAS